jgi:hypothetical protein
MDEHASKKLTAMFKNMKGSGRVVGGMMDMRANMNANRMHPSPRNPPKMQMEGNGFLSDLGIPVVSDVAGMFGLGKKKRAVGATDGRRARAEIVKKVMASKGLSMINASKYVKEHNLY